MSTLKNNMSAIYGSNGKEWFSQLPFLMEKYARQWNLSNLIALPNLTFNYVLSGLQDIMCPEI